MNHTTKSLIVAALAALAVAVVPSATARDIGVCADDVYNQDYQECYGVMDGCGAAGVGHWYTYEGSSTNPPAGEAGGWCFLSVRTGGGDIAAVCTDTEYHVYDGCIVTIG